MTNLTHLKSTGHPTVATRKKKLKSTLALLSYSQFFKNLFIVVQFIINSVRNESVNMLHQFC